MKNPLFNWLAALCLLLGLPSGLIAGGAANNEPCYKYTLISERPDLYPFFFSINNAGTVAFTTEAGIVTGGQVFIGNGGPITPIFTSTCTGSCPPIDTSINNRGTVVIRHGNESGQGFISVLSGGVMNTIVADDYIALGPPFINDREQIVFTQSIPGEGRAVIVFERGVFTRIATNLGDPFARINDPGTVVFSSTVPSEEGVPITTIFTANGGTTSRIVDPSGPFAVVSPIPDINNRGTVAFSATLDAGGAGIFTIRNGTVTTVADTSGPFAGAVFDVYSLNNREEVAFAVTSLSTGLTLGVFTGPDPIADKVIGIGDSLFGSTVMEVRFSRQGLNDQGQVAFWALLQDGRRVVVRADPSKKRGKHPA